MNDSPRPQPEVLLTGLALGESPRWHAGRLWFSDWLAHEIVAVDLDGNREVILNVPSMPFSFDWLPDGRLLILSNGDGRRLQRREPDGSLVTHAELTSLVDRPWNEIVVDGRGNAYVNSICFDLMAGEESAPGIIAVVAPDGTVRQVADGLEFPNGMAVTPDNSTLVVAESYAKRLTAFDIAADGGLSNRRVWAEVVGYPDGICLDADNAVWCAAMLRCLRVGEGGRVLQTIELDRSCFACMLGGREHRTLFIMAAEWNGPDGIAAEARTGQVLAAAAPTPRAGWP
jgi:sugar lactone lactonase YvrE